jgi:hypothetical protein
MEDTENKSIISSGSSNLDKIEEPLNINHKILKVYKPKYESVMIGEHEWIDYDLAGEPSWCYYDFDPENGKKFGKLYNFHAIYDPRGLSPENFSIPTLNDFIQLIDFLEKENNEVGFKDWIKNYYYIFDIYSNVNKSNPPIITKLFLKLFPKQYS